MIIGILLGISNLILLFLLNKKLNKHISETKINKSNFILKEDLNVFKTNILNKLNWLSSFKEQIEKRITYLKTVVEHVKKSR